jgi:hypothetical protein
VTTETITFDEVGEFLGLAAARDQRTVGDADILAWHADLNAAGVTMTAATNALTHYYAVLAPKLDPHQRHRVNAPDLLAIIRKARADRHNQGTYVDDGSRPDETAQQYVARKRSTERAIGDGRMQPPPAIAAIGPAPANGPQELTEDDVRALRQQKDLMRMMREAGREAAVKDQARKELVLRYPDLAERLAKEHGLSSADKWNGRIPPEFTGGGARNPWPIRTALVEIVAEAEARAATASRAAA